jgi:hypothetical protein
MDPAMVEAVGDVVVWTRWRWRWSVRHQHGPDGGGGGAEKKTSVGGGSSGGFIIHLCGGDGQADGADPAVMDPMVVEAVGEAAASKKVQENLAAYQHPSQNPPVRV